MYKPCIMQGRPNRFVSEKSMCFVHISFQAFQPFRSQLVFDLLQKRYVNTMDFPLKICTMQN
jgi:hypothetical protein